MNDLALPSFPHRCHSTFPVHWFTQDILTSGHHGKTLWGSICTDNFTALYHILEWPSFNSWKTVFFSASQHLPMLFLLLRMLFLHTLIFHLTNFFTSWCLGWQFINTSSPRPNELFSPPPLCPHTQYDFSLFIVSYTPCFCLTELVKMYKNIFYLTLSRLCVFWKEKYLLSNMFTLFYRQIGLPCWLRQ